MGRPPTIRSGSTFYTEQGLVSGEPLEPVHRLLHAAPQARRKANRGTSSVLGIARRQKTAISMLWQGEWQGVRGNSLIANRPVRACACIRGRMSYLDTTSVGRWDIETESVTGANRGCRGASRSIPASHQRLGDLVQAELRFTGTMNSRWASTTHQLQLPVAGTLEAGQLPCCSTNDGAPLRRSAASSTPRVRPADGRRHYLGIYGTDSWTIGRRLTLNLGLRYARDGCVRAGADCREAAGAPSDVVFPAECFPQVEFRPWNSVAPRLHAAYDLAGDGKTVLKGGWGRYRPHARTRRRTCERFTKNTGLHGHLSTGAT